MASLGGADKATATTSARGSQHDRQQALQHDRQQALAFARCLRQHGITNLPDPQITADGIDEQLPTGMHKDNPRLKAAWRACEQSGRGGR